MLKNYKFHRFRKMSITTYSSIATVKKATLVDPTSTTVSAEIDLWNYLTFYTSDMTPNPTCSYTSCGGDSTDLLTSGGAIKYDYFRIGLFAYDLTTFKANCAIATKNCLPANYRAFDGWAVGMYGGVHSDASGV